MITGITPENFSIKSARQSDLERICHERVIWAANPTSIRHVWSDRWPRASDISLVKWRRSASGAKLQEVPWNGLGNVSDGAVFRISVWTVEPFIRAVSSSAHPAAVPGEAAERARPTRFYQTWPKLTWPDLNRHDMTWQDQTRPDPTRFYPTQPGQTHPDPTIDQTRPDWPDLTWSDLTRPHQIRPDPIWSGPSQFNQNRSRKPSLEKHRWTCRTDIVLFSLIQADIHLSLLWFPTFIPHSVGGGVSEWPFSRYISLSIAWSPNLLELLGHLFYTLYPK